MTTRNNAHARAGITAALGEIEQGNKPAGHTPGPWADLRHVIDTLRYLYRAGQVKPGGISLTAAQFDQLCDMAAAAPELLAALEDAQRMLETASRYMPKSIKNADRFSLLNVLANSVAPAIAKARGQG